MRPAALLLLLWPVAGIAQGDAPAVRASVLEQQAEQIAESVEKHRGRPVSEVEVACDAAKCADPEHLATLRRVTRVTPGLPFEPMAVARGWIHLTRSGYFRAIQVQVLPDGESVRVRYNAISHFIIADIDLEYAETSSKLYPQQFDTEIKKRLLLHKGGHFDPDDTDLIQRQRTSILELYERQGYTGTRLDIQVTPDRDNPQFVQLRIEIDEGHLPWLGEVLIRGNRALSYSRLVEPLSTGERADFWRPFFGALGIGRYDRRRLLEELKEVEQIYRDEGWLSARVRLRGEARRRNTLHPKVEVYEGPRVELAFEGNDYLDDDDLAEVTTFAESGAIDPTEVEASVEAIRGAYQSVAHYWARVTAEREALPDGTVRITFHIQEGPRIFVDRVVVHGNRRLDDETVRGAMETLGIAPTGVVSGFQVSPGVLQEARIANDLVAIRELYRDRGFLGAQFRCKPTEEPVEAWNERRLAQIHGRLPADAPPHFDVWTSDPARFHCFVVERTSVPSLVTLHLELNEGLQTTVGRLDIGRLVAGMSPELQDEAQDLLFQLDLTDELGHWRRRAGLNRPKLEAVRGFLLKWYRQSGYLQASVRPVCDPQQKDAIDPDSEDTCTPDDLYGRHFDLLAIETRSGPQTLVDGILLSGNLQTDADIIHNELLFEPGGPLSSDGLFMSQANLRSLGIFEGVRVETLGEQLPVAENSPLLVGFTPNSYRRDATVLVTVEEGDYVLLDANIGLRIDSSPLGVSDLPILYVGGLTLRDRNLFGRAIEVGVSGQHSNRIDEPGNVTGDDATWQVGPFLHDPRFFNTRLDLLLSFQYTLSRTETRDEYAESLALTADVGYDFFNLSYPSEWGRGLRTSLTAELQRERRRGLARDIEPPPFGEFVDSVTLGPAVDVDKRDNPLHPTRGWLLRQANEIFFRSDELAPDEIAPSFRETLTAQWVQSFFDKRLIIVPTARGGLVQTDKAEKDLKSDFLFKAGGDGVSVPVRGYLDAAIDACGGVATETGPCAEARDPDDNPKAVGGHAMLSGSLEIRFPTFLVDDFWWVAFGDAAAVTPEVTDLDWDRFYPSVGVGLRWLVTGQIPLRVDVGLPLRTNELAPEGDPRFHLSIFYPL